MALSQVPVTLVPAVPGVVNLPMRIMVQQNNAFYTSNSGDVNFAYGSPSSPTATNSVSLFFEAGLVKYLDDALFTKITNADASLFVGQPYIAFATDQVTEDGGTGGDVTFTVWYTALTVQ